MARNKNKSKGRNKGGGGNKNKGSSGGGSKQAQSSSSPSRRQQAKAAANMSVKQRRTAAKEAGVGLKDFKAGRTGANAVARRDAQRESNRPGPRTPGPQQQTGGNTFTTAAGYQMEKGGYRQGAQDILDQYKKDAPNSMMVKNAGIEGFDKDGYLGYDSTKAQFQNNTALKEAGYKEGDMLWKPGALDNLNGRKLTGRIARITELGNYVPEYEHDAVNSSHRSTGNAGYAGEVGLGADQGAYNREYERNNDVTSGQVNQQLEVNGIETNTEVAGLNDGMNENNNGFTNDYGNGFSTAPNMRLSNASTAEQAANQNYAPYDFSGNGSFSKKKSLSSGMNFSFNPGKFMQGQ